MESNTLDARQIRIFISSTFKDMQAERGYLVTKVFPKLRRYCEKREVSIFELDLRWGISEEEAKQGKVFDICLREVQKTRPFFIGLLGERYGWIPTEEERKAIAENTAVFEDYPWIAGELDEGTSITEIEIQEGVLRSNKKINAYFYLRSPKMEIADEFKEEKGSHQEKMLSELKSELRRQDKYPVKEYDSIEQLGTFVENDFTALIDALFPEAEMTPLDLERLEQRNFLKSRARVYAANPEWNARLEAFAGSPQKAIVISGGNGMGKSALIANWINERNEQRIKNEKIIYHFIGESRSGADYRKITGRLIDEVRDIYNIPAAGQDKASMQEGNQKNAKDKQKEEWQSLLFSLPETEKIVIVLDGINRLINTDNAKLLNWIPPFPENVKIIFSTLTDDESMEAFKRLGYGLLNIGALPLENRIQLAEDYLQSFSKKLTPAQTHRISSDAKCENPLVLLSILDELRVFGVHEKIDAQIDFCLSAPDSEGLFARLLQRIEELFSGNSGQKNFVKDILSLIALSRRGLSETEILELSGAAPLYWSQLSNGMTGHLSTINGFVSFSNRMMLNAVKKRYLPNSSSEKPCAEEQNCRSRIAAYMETQASFERRCDELPFQLNELKEWDRLYNFLLDYKVFNYIYKKYEHETRAYWRNLREINDNRYSMEKYLELYANVDDKEIETFYEVMVIFLLDSLLNDDSLTLKFAVKYREICEKVYGEKSEKTAFSYDLVGDIYISLQNIENALEVHKQALEIKKEIYENSNKEENLRHIASSYNFIGMDYHFLGNQKALEYYNMALEIQRSILGEKNIETAKTYQNLGIYCSRIKDYQKGLEYIGKASDIFIELLGKNHNYTAASYWSLGTCHYRQSEYGKALKYWREAAAIYENILDKNNIFFTTIYNNIAVICQDNKNYGEALEYYGKARVLKEELFGKNHIKTYQSYCNIASCYSEMCDLKNAIEYRKESIAIKEKISNENDSDVALACYEIAGEYNALGDNEKALEYKDKGASIYSSLVREDFDKLDDVPKEHKTPELCKLAIQKNGYALKYVPEELKTPEICKLAVQGNPSAFFYVPENLKTPELCFIAVHKDGHNLSNVPAELKTPELCLAAVQKLSYALNYVPEELKTPELCLAAVQQTDYALEYVPDQLKAKVMDMLKN